MEVLAGEMADESRKQKYQSPVQGSRREGKLTERNHGALVLGREENAQGLGAGGSGDRTTSGGRAWVAEPGAWARG